MTEAHTIHGQMTIIINGGHQIWAFTEALEVLGTEVLDMEDLGMEDLGMEDLEARLALEDLEARLALEDLEVRLALEDLEVRLALEDLEAPFLILSFSANLIREHLTLCPLGNQSCLT
jgi:hypothetical protein